ncbi:MAG: hypothetical protein ABSF77_09095 [Spirochaetia bacterium]
MRRSRDLSTFVFNVVIALCSLALIAALTAAGVGLLALVSVYTSLCVFLFLPFFPRSPAVVHVRRASPRVSARAPPLC